LDEEERYKTHNNQLDNEDYIQYMETFIKSHVRPLKNVKTILDFGSGPYPILGNRLEKHGYTVTGFDPFFQPNTDYKTHTYDLIILQEVLEHIQDPNTELDELCGLLNPGGFLLIQTGFRYTEDEAFFRWWYVRDLTHIAFYSMKTFEYISNNYPLDIVSTNQKTVILYQKR
jgi:2-polyprenyl-3-methyl-5-hydroxy-6-metoxy-1,4-benzoquinol methylase